MIENRPNSFQPLGSRMANQPEPESTIALEAPMDGGQSQSAGQVILKLLHKTAGAAEANSRRGRETAQELSTKLLTAQSRIAELEAEVQFYQEKSERAEDWLRKISAEIQDRLISEPEEHRRRSLGL
jgi:hypothetical protein